MKKWMSYLSTFVWLASIFSVTCTAICANAQSTVDPTKNTVQAEALNAQLAPFQAMIGKTFKGEFADSTPEKPKFDVSKWERAMNGQAVRCLHSINDGEYGGETILMWNDEAKKISYWYFSTGGFMTEGTIEINGNTWTSVENVKGSANGITKVRATSQLLESGELDVKSEYFANGKWTPGHALRYQPSPTSEVKFR